MMKALVRACAALALATLSGACASMTTGTTQSISVTSEPSEADCTLTRDGQSLGTIKTPGPVKVKRDARAIQVTCKKDGHEEGLSIVNSRFEGATMGNLILGGAVGLAVDVASGASNRYDDTVMVKLAPLPGWQPPPQPPAQPAPPPASPAVVSASPRPADPIEEAPPAPIAPGSGMSRSRL
jgi:hypothetical protein